MLRVEDIENKERVIIEVNEIFKTDKAHLRAGVNLQVYKAKHCAYPDFEKNQQYLIMLKHEVIYVVDGDAFILAWPKEIKKITKLRKALNEVRKDSLCFEAGKFINFYFIPLHFVELEKICSKHIKNGHY